MKILKFSDLHTHNFKEFSEQVDGMNSRLKDCISVLNKIKNCAEKNNCSLILFLGDLFNAKNLHDAQVVQKVGESLSAITTDLAIPMLLLPGNHDYRSWDRDPSLIQLFEGVIDNIEFVLEPGWLKEGRVFELLEAVGVRVYAEPYTRRISELSDRLQALETNKETDIFLGHQDINGIAYGGYIVNNGLDPDLLSGKFKWSFVGHYHNPKEVRDNVISLGAPLQHHFGDIGQKRGWWLFDTEADEIEFIENTTSSKFFDLNSEQEIPGDLTKDFYRIKVTGDKMPEEYKKIKWKRVSYERTSETKNRSSITFSDSIENLLVKYVKMKSNGLEESRLIEIGRRYLK